VRCLQSKRASLTHRTGANTILHESWCRDFHVDAKDLFGFLFEADQIEKRPSVVELDEQIDIACIRLFATCDGSEDSNMANAVTSSGVLESPTRSA